MPQPEPQTTHAMRQILPDLLVPGLRLVFCGTAPSRRSAAEQAYYAHPGNRFWPALHESGLVPRRLYPQEYPELLSFGIGLTDLAKHHSGNDRDLPAGAFDREALQARLRRYRPTWLAFTSKQAARAALAVPRIGYGLQPQTLESCKLFVLPSPSGQARGHWDLRPWIELAGLSAIRR